VGDTKKRQADSVGSVKYMKDKAADHHCRGKRGVKKGFEKKCYHKVCRRNLRKKSPSGE